MNEQADKLARFGTAALCFTNAESGVIPLGVIRNVLRYYLSKSENNTCKIGKLTWSSYNLKSASNCTEIQKQTSRKDISRLLSLLTGHLAAR